MSDAPSAAPFAALSHGGTVVGIGTDLCEVPRIAEALSRHGDRFLGRLFLDGEIRRPRSSPAFAEHVAGLFAAKEAAMKALGSGMKGVAFREIVILRERGAAPRLSFRGRAACRADALGVKAAHVTITHTRTLASAVVLLLARED